VKVAVVLKLLVLIFLTVLLCSCGVDTSSNSASTTDTGSGVDIGLDLIDPNPIYPDTNTTDNNSTTDDNNTTPGTVTDSIFDTNGAILDAFACMVGTYTPNVIADTSFDPIGVVDEEYGVAINSKYPYNNDIAKTEVKLYYSTLKPQRTMKMINIYEDNFRVSVDTAWSTNDDTVIYVKTPLDSNDLYGCYRYELNGIDANSTVTGTKVYRNTI
jgi:hypothetical protein